MPRLETLAVWCGLGQGVAVRNVCIKKSDLRPHPCCETGNWTPGSSVSSLLGIQRLRYVKIILYFALYYCLYYCLENYLFAICVLLSLQSTSDLCITVPYCPYTLQRSVCIVCLHCVFALCVHCPYKVQASKAFVESTVYYWSTSLENDLFSLCVPVPTKYKLLQSTSLKDDLFALYYCPYKLRERSVCVCVVCTVYYCPYKVQA